MPVNQMHKWIVNNDFDTASKKAADFLANKIIAVLNEKKQCHVALPGGNSPVQCLRYLADMDLPWNKLHWYLGDERCYPQGHQERNDVMLQENFWSLINETNIHRIAAELGPEAAAEDYRNIISSIEQLDIAFLGVGEDGHTASLFPGNDALNDHRSVVPVYHSPKPPAERVSLSLDTLQKARSRMVLSGTASKSSILKRIKEGEPLPVNCIGNITWFIDNDV